MKAEQCISIPKVDSSKIISAKIETINKQNFLSLIKSTKIPEYGEFEVISSKHLQALKHQEFVKEVYIIIFIDFYKIQLSLKT